MASGSSPDKPAIEMAEIAAADNGLGVVVEKTEDGVIAHADWTPEEEAAVRRKYADHR